MEVKGKMETEVEVEARRGGNRGGEMWVLKRKGEMKRRKWN